MGRGVNTSKVSSPPFGVHETNGLWGILKERELNELINVEKINPIEVFTKKGMDPLLASITKEVEKFEPDTSSPTGRKAIASMANKVARSKTLLDGFGKDLVSDWKKQAKAVDESRKTMREKLDALKTQVRRPLTIWEEKESRRLTGIQNSIEALESLAKGNECQTAEDFKKQRIMLNNINLDIFQEFQEKAGEIQAVGLITLKEKYDRQFKFEEQQEELRKMRAETEARRAKEEEERKAREEKELAEKAEREAKEQEERLKVQAAEMKQLEAERKLKEAEEDKKRLKAEAIEAKKLAEERIKDAERKAEERKDLEKQREKNRIEAKKLEVERAKQKEMNRLEAIKLREQVAEQGRVFRIEQEKQAKQKAELEKLEAVEQKKQAEEAARKKREADEKHKEQVLCNIVDMITRETSLKRMEAGEVVRAIAANKIISLRIEY